MLNKLSHDLKFGGTAMLTAILFIALVLPAMFLGHMAHEEILSQKAYRKATRVR